MKYQLTSKDVPKIILVMVVLIASIGTAAFKSRNAEAQREKSESIKHLTLELGMPVIDSSDTKAEREKQIEDAAQEHASAQNSATSVR